MTVHAIQAIRSRHEWAEVINDDWRRSIESIIQTGRDLIAAKEDLPNGEFGKMIKEDLTFGINTADQLMRIALHPVIAESPPAGILPPSWAVLSELLSLKKEDFESAQSHGLIDANTGKRMARAISGAYKVPEGGIVGEGSSVSMLPSPSEARQVARATNRLVAASDGNLYSGSTEEEGDDYNRRRDQTYSVIDSINVIVESGVSPKQWVDEAKDHWLNRFEFGRIVCAVAWLTELRAEMIRQKKVFDCEGVTNEQ